MGPDLMELFQKQAARFGTEFLNDMISKVSLQTRPFIVETSRQRVSCDALIVATGAKARLLGTKGESELMGYGVSTCATCDGAFFRNKVIVVVGGGDSACEEALFLSRFGSKVFLIHRRNQMRASKIMQERVLQHEKVSVLWNRELVEICGSKEAGVSSILLRNKDSAEDERLECSAVFIAIGHIPNSTIFKDQLDTDQAGYLITKPDSTSTKTPGVFACGDVQDHVFRQAITAAGSGCMAAIEAERWLESNAD
jgi:thioredoxin reductase (NADPH)